MFLCVYVGGESTCGVNTVRAAGDGNATAAADRNTAADVDSKGMNPLFSLFIHMSSDLFMFGLLNWEEIACPMPKSTFI